MQCHPPLTVSCRIEDIQTVAAMNSGLATTLSEPFNGTGVVTVKVVPGETGVFDKTGALTPPCAATRPRVRHQRRA